MMKKVLWFFLIFWYANSFAADYFVPNGEGNQLKHAPYKLVLFFSNQCPHCVRFAPVIKYFMDSEGWEVEALSLNEGTLPEFPNATFANQSMIDSAYLGNPVVYPALFVANKRTKTLYPVAYGEMGYQELKERLAVISEKITIYERGLQR